MKIGAGYPNHSTYRIADSWFQEQFFFNTVLQMGIVLKISLFLFLLFNGVFLSDVLWFLVLREIEAFPRDLSRDVHVIVKHYTLQYSEHDT